MKHVCTIGGIGLLALVCSALPALGDGVDWSQYLGPDRTGTTPEQGFVKEWGGEGPPIAWRKQIGTGFASMTAVGDRVYAVGNQGGDEEVLYCLDAESGEEVWTVRYASELVDNLHEGGPGSTPIVHDGAVYAVSRIGEVRRVDAQSGEQDWMFDLREVLGLEVPDWGFTSSVVIDEGVGYLQAGATVAFDPADGEILWKSRQHAPAYSTPQPFDYKGERHLAVLNSYGLVLVDASDGSEVASTEWEGQFDTNATTPHVIGDRIFIATGYNKGHAMFQLREDGQISQLYRSQEFATQMDTAVLHEGHFYGVHGNNGRRALNDLMCLDAETGEVKWAHNDFGCGSVIAADGTLLILSEDGELVTAEATPEGFEEISRGRILEGRCWTAPVLAHGRLFARNADGELVCVDLRP